MWVERHVGRLSHLTTVSPVLIQTETWRGEDYRRLLEHPSEKAFQRRYYAKHPAISKVLFVGVEPSRTWCLVSHPSVFLFRGGGKQGFMEDIYQLAFANINSKQMIRMPKSACGRNRCRAVHRGTGTDGFVSSMAVWNESFRLQQKARHSPVIEVTRSCRCMLSEDWKDENIYTFRPGFPLLFFFFFYWWSQHQAVILSYHPSRSLPSVRHRVGWLGPRPPYLGIYTRTRIFRRVVLFLVLFLQICFCVASSVTAQASMVSYSMYTYIMLFLIPFAKIVPDAVATMTVLKPNKSYLPKKTHLLLQYWESEEARLI